MQEKEPVNQIIQGIKGIDENVTGVIVPILKDTITDYKRVVSKLVTIIIILILMIAILSGLGFFIISNQIKKYNEFLSQFDFENDTSVYQDTDDASSINSGITINTSKDDNLGE